MTSTHQHEQWQLLDSAKGPGRKYCGACGADVPEVPKFTARLAGVTYTDREAFEGVAVGFLPRQPRWRGDGPKLAVGEPVTFTTSRFLPEYVSGQVWSEAPDRDTWWVRGDDGRTYLLRGSVGLAADSRTGVLL